MLKGKIINAELLYPSKGEISADIPGARRAGMRVCTGKFAGCPVHRYLHEIATRCLGEGANGFRSNGFGRMTAAERWRMSKVKRVVINACFVSFGLFLAGS